MLGLERSSAGEKRFGSQWEGRFSRVFFFWIGVWASRPVGMNFYVLLVAAELWVLWDRGKQLLYFGLILSWWLIFHLLPDILSKLIPFSGRIERVFGKDNMLEQNAALMLEYGLQTHPSIEACRFGSIEVLKSPLVKGCRSKKRVQYPQKTVCERTKEHLRTLSGFLFATWPNWTKLVMKGRVWKEEKNMRSWQPHLGAQSS